MDSQAQGAGLVFWGRWLIATTIGWIVGTIAAIVLSYLVVNLVYPKTTNLIVGLCMGAAIGVSQKMAVRRWIKLAGGWVWGAMVGLGIPFVVTVLVDERWARAEFLPENWVVGQLLIAVVGGFLAGLLQFRYLRPYTSRASWWILVSVVSCGLAWLSTSLSGPGGLVVGGVVLGAVSGGLLILLLREPTANEAV